MLSISHCLNSYCHLYSYRGDMYEAWNRGLVRGTLPLENSILLLYCTAFITPRVLHFSAFNFSMCLHLVAICITKRQVDVVPVADMTVLLQVDFLLLAPQYVNSMKTCNHGTTCIHAYQVNGVCIITPWLMVCA